MDEVLGGQMERGTPSKREFPLVYSPATNSQALVSDYLEILHEAAVWQPIFRCPTFDWELSNIAAMLGRLESAKVVLN